MSTVLVIVQKSWAGNEWTNTHAVQFGGSGTGAVSQADLDALGAGSTLTDANTDATPGPTILDRILSFERQLLSSGAIINRVYVTDGKRNATADPDYYAVLSASFAGLVSVGAMPHAAVLPGNVVLQVNRQPAGYGRRPGRLFLRAVLQETEVILGGPKLVTWTDGAAATAVSNRVQTAVANSLLGQHFAGGAGATVATYAIPRYARGLNGVPLPNEGELIDSTPVGSLITIGPAGRQANRGRKRKAS